MSDPQSSDTASGRPNVGFSDGAAQVVTTLRERGFALFDGTPDAASLRTFAQSFGVIVPHRDSTADGVTTICPLNHRVLPPGFAAFSASDLHPHTDRSGTAQPPNMVLLACGREPDSGGECVVIDGQAVYRDLAVTAPDALRTLRNTTVSLVRGRGRLSRCHLRQLARWQCHRALP